MSIETFSTCKFGRCDTSLMNYRHPCAAHTCRLNSKPKSALSTDLPQLLELILSLRPQSPADCSLAPSFRHR